MLQVNRDTKIGNIANVVNEKSPSFSGIVSQECKGKLWVNDIEMPTIALAESYAVGSFAFLGTYKTDEDFLCLRDFLENDLFVHLRENGYDCFEFSVESESIRDSILKMFRDKSIKAEKEFSFRINTVPEKKKDIPNQYQLKKVDASLWDKVTDGKYENTELLKTRLLESWHSFEDFEDKSAAYCVIFKNRIVAVMVGTACFNNVIDIDIETEEEHRRKGLAYAMAVEFISDCLKNDHIPQWDCVESNPNSYNLAKKLGFKLFKENTVYWFKL